MKNLFDTISNFIEGEQDFGNFGFIINLLYNIELSKEPKISNFNKKGSFDFGFKEFSYELNLDSLKVSLSKLEIIGLQLHIDISSYLKEPKEKIILEAKDIKGHKNINELTLLNRVIDYVLQKNFIPEIEIKDFFVSIGISQQHIENTPRLEILVNKFSLKNSDDSGKFFNKILKLKDLRVRIKPPFKTLSKGKVNYFENENIIAITNNNKGDIINEEMVIELKICDENNHILIELPLKFIEIVLDNLQLQYLNNIIDILLYIDPKIIIPKNETTAPNINNQSFLLNKFSNVQLKFSLEMFNIVLFNNFLDSPYKIWLSKRSQGIYDLELIKNYYCFYNQNFYLLNIQSIEIHTKLFPLKNQSSLKFKDIYLSYVHSILHSVKEEKTEFCSIADEESLNKEKTEEEKIQLFIQELIDKNEFEYYSYTLFNFDGKLMDQDFFELYHETEIVISSEQTEMKKISLINGKSSPVKLNFHPIVFFLSKTIVDDNYVTLRYLLNHLISLNNDIIGIDKLLNLKDIITPKGNQNLSGDNLPCTSEIIFSIEGIDIELSNFSKFEEFINFFTNDQIFGLQPYLFTKLKDENFKKYFEKKSSIVLSIKEVIISMINYVGGPNVFSFTSKSATLSLSKDFKIFELIKIYPRSLNSGEIPIKIYSESKMHPALSSKLLDELKLAKVSEELERFLLGKEQISINKLSIESNSIEVNIYLENLFHILNFFDDFIYIYSFQDIFQIISKMNIIITKMYRSFNNLPYLAKNTNKEVGIFSSLTSINKIDVNIYSMSEKLTLMNWILEKIYINFSMIDFIKFMDLRINNFLIYLPNENSQNIHYMLYKPSDSDKNVLEVCMKHIELRKNLNTFLNEETYFDTSNLRNIDREKYGYYLKDQFIYQNLNEFLENNLIVLNDNEMYLDFDIKNLHISPFTINSGKNVHLLKIIRLLNCQTDVKNPRYVICKPNKLLHNDINIGISKLVIDLYSLNLKNLESSKIENKMRLILIFKELEIKFEEENEKKCSNLTAKSNIYSYFVKNLSYRNLIGKLEIKEDEFMKVGLVNLINFNEVFLVIRIANEVSKQEDYHLRIGKISLRFCSDSLRYFLIFLRSFSENDFSEKSDKIEEIKETEYINKLGSSKLISTIKSIIYFLKIDEIDIYLYENEDFNFEKNLQLISHRNQEIKVVNPGSFNFKVYTKNINYVDNYLDEIYMSKQKIRNRSNSKEKEDRETIHLKIESLTVDLLKTIKIDGDIFNFSFSINKYSIYDNSVKSKFYLLKQWIKNGNEINQKLLSLNMKGYTNDIDTTIEMFELKQLPLELIIDLSTLSFLMNFLNFTSDIPSTNQKSPESVNNSDIKKESKENTGNCIVRYFIISSVEFKINTRYKGYNQVFGNVLDTLAPKFIEIKNFEDFIKEFKRQYDLDDKIPLQSIINELVDFYYSQFTKYNFLSKALSSIRILRPIGDFFNGIIGVFRLPIKYYIKGDNVLIGFAHGVGNLLYKWSRGSYQLCKNVINPFYRKSINLTEKEEKYD